MPLLLYCVAPETAGETRVEGVGGAKVIGAVHGGLRYFVSETQGAVPTAEIANAARSVFEVVNDVFSRGPVLQFRYPTMVASEAELKKLAADRGEGFSEFLRRIGSRVQMDVRLNLVEPGKREPTMGTGLNALVDQDLDPRNAGRRGEIPGNGAPGDASDNVHGSGREYLQARARRKTALAAAAEKCRQQAVSENWQIEERQENLICHVLIERVQVISFQERMSRLDLPEGVKGVVSGPWPPAAFWEEKPH